MTQGTRFRVFARPPYGGGNPPLETIELSSPAGSLGPGPSDDRMYALEPVGKAMPYGERTDPEGRPLLYLPPWEGTIQPLAEPGPQGHFDHLAPDTPEFEAAHLFACARLVLDVWERYLGRPVRWHFGRMFERLELSVLQGWDNGQMGFGYLEVGSRPVGDRRPSFVLNFDVIAHEIGHAILYAELGLPALENTNGEYFGFHESAADWVAMVASLHFPSVCRQLLETSHGNLYTFNHFNRFGELSPTRQIRTASNTLKLSDFARGWRDEHKLAEPLTGAVFDSFVDIFHEILVERGVLSRGAEELADIALNYPHLDRAVQDEFDRTYAAAPGEFLIALQQARDLMGGMLADSWARLDPLNVGYAEFGDALLAVDASITGGKLRSVLWSNLVWRDIGNVTAGPRIAPPTARSHIFSPRSVVPGGQNQGKLARLANLIGRRII